jgi:hypothetical protein
MLQELKGYRCTQCGCFLNVSKETYQEHMATYHSQKQQPIRKMTPEEIAAAIHRVEKGWLAPHLYVPSTLKSKEVVKVEKKVEAVNEAPVVHDADCKCMTCWHKLLDALLAKQEAELAAVKSPQPRPEPESVVLEKLSTVLDEMVPIKVKTLEADIVLHTNDVEWKG